MFPRLCMARCGSVRPVALCPRVLCDSATRAVASALSLVLTIMLSFHQGSRHPPPHNYLVAICGSDAYTPAVRSSGLVRYANFSHKFSCSAHARTYIFDTHTIHPPIHALGALGLENFRVFYPDSVNFVDRNVTLLLCYVCTE